MIYLFRYPPGYFTLNYDFDFFNYAGIHRTVYLYTTPESFIEDITVNTTASGTTGGNLRQTEKFHDCLYYYCSLKCVKT